MKGCMFSAHCLELKCDKSCPKFAETRYLLDRNNISFDSNVFCADPKQITAFNKLIEVSQGKLVSIVKKETAPAAELLTYLSICQTWHGSRLHCTTYNIKYFQYLDMLKQSWSLKDGSDFEYVKIWASTASVLIISGLDYVNFKDFESQTLLQLIQARQMDRLTTIVVAPPLTSLVGSGMFFDKLKTLLREVQK